jgi:hypothetical protein
MANEMKQAAHTPGPWFVDEDDRPGMEWNRHIYSGPQLAVCFMAHSDGKAPERDAANARLIAAAPDLLEALQEVMFVMDMALCVEMLPPGADGPVAKARAAIAAATPTP